MIGAITINLYKKDEHFCADIGGSSKDSLDNRCRRFSKLSYQDATGKLAIESQGLFGIYVVLRKDEGKIGDLLGEDCLMRRKLIFLFKDKPMFEDDIVFYAKYAGTILLSSSDNSETEALGNLLSMQREIMKVSFNVID